MNVEDWEAAALHDIVARVDEEARAHGAEVDRLRARRADACGRRGRRGRGDAQDRRLRLVARARASPARLTSEPAQPVSGIATAAAANTLAGAATAKSGETKSSPVACAPRWTSEISPVTRPRKRSGTSSWAAELSSTHDDPCPTPATKPGRERDLERAGDREQAVGGQVEHPGQHARARLAADREAREHGAGADRAERVRRPRRARSCPAPRSSVERTSSGTPTIHVPEEIVTATPSTTTAAASAGRGRSAAKPSRIRGCRRSAPSGRPRRANAGEQQRRTRRTTPRSARRTR